MAKIHGAILHATVNPNGSDASVKFLYGTDPALDFPTEVNLPVTPAGHDAVPVAQSLTELDAETTYYFKISATNDDGTTEGAILSFLTPADGVGGAGAPIVETLPATDIL